MPWGWGELPIDPDNPRSAPYHLVWARDLYQIATALLAAGDTRRAPTARSTSCSTSSSSTTARSRRTPRSTGTPKWTAHPDGPGRPADRARLAARPHRRERLAPRPRRGRLHRRQRARESEQERWENQEGYSPGDDRRRDRRPRLRRRHRPPQRRRRRAPRPTSARPTPGQRNVQRWTATTNGPYAPKPYYLRLTKDRKPDRGTTYAIGDSGPSKIDQRRVVDVSLPRARPARRQARRRPGDRQHAAGRRRASSKAGAFWHRFTLRRLRRAPRRQAVASVR